MAADERFPTVNEFPFSGELASIDPLVSDLITREEERQERRLILIPSESLCHPVVRKTMDSVYGNLYAEGYPSSLATFLKEDRLNDVTEQLAYYRRYADRRFYKGTEMVDIVEALCRRRAAEAFATPTCPAESIFANVQALSGAAANMAVEEALLKPGDTLLSMDLMHGGHLSHGSPFHVSGRRYRVVSYGISPKTHQLDYDEIERLANAEKPRLIIGGFSSYPFAPDWQRLRAIADAVGAFLMADVAHPAGMVAAGVYPSPMGIADVVTFTTHKTLLGPRGAVILTTNEDLAKAIDNAVFPGEQGGPHVNSQVALCVALKLATTPEFKALQKAIVDNAAFLAKELIAQGLKLAYGGTDTHLLLIDLKALPKRGTEQLRGEMAVRILELAGIVCNKNTIPGDTLTALATGVRIGTPWITQRGITKPQLSELAAIMAEVLKGIHPFRYEGLLGPLPRGKVDFDLLQSARKRVAALANALSGHPAIESVSAHYNVPAALALDTLAPKGEAAVNEAAAVMYEAPAGLIRVVGERAEWTLQNLLATDLNTLAVGEARRSLLLDKDAKVIDDVVVSRLRAKDETPDNGFMLVANPERAEKVLLWLRGNGDGYLLFDDADIMAKVEGPVVVDELCGANASAKERFGLIELHGKKAVELAKASGAEIIALPGENTAYLVVKGAAIEATEKALIGQGALVIGHAERAIWRAAAKLPAANATAKTLIEAGQTAWFAPEKTYFVGQRAVVELLPKPAPGKLFTWNPPEGPTKRTTLYAEHAKRTKKIVPFAGWDMPVWYTSAFEEHEAVRKTAALFDVSHMGVFEISGEGAGDFLDLVTTNYVRWIKDGESYYAFILKPDGHALDDTMVYRLSRTKYLMVVNASNEDQDWAWLNMVNNNEALLDPENPSKRVLIPAKLRSLKDRQWGEECRVDIALQGPRSRDTLLALLDPTQRQRLKAMRRTGVGEFTLAGLPVVLSRTGYTGEAMGFEIFVHPDKAPELFNKILEAGAPMGVIAAGLASRDSTRTEAGLPLYGHELEGHYDITPAGSGFGSYVKFHKPFFVGKKALLEREAKRDKVVVRFEVEKGAKPLKTGDTVASPKGDFLGHVTSCAFVPDGRQFGLANVLIKAAKPGEIAVFSVPAENRRAGLVNPIELTDDTKVVLPVAAKIVSRFPAKPDRPQPKD